MKVWCDGCHTEQRFPLPMGLKEVADLCRKFRKEHAKCRKEAEGR